MYIPDEISNHICSYIEGPNNKIINELYDKVINNMWYIWFEEPLDFLKLNKKYKFKHINIERLVNAIHTRCPHCWTCITPQEYLYKGLYEIITKKKLCFDCIEKEKTRVLIEYNELIILIVILITIVRFDILIYIMCSNFI
jgi:hypothetical protein